MINQKIMNFSEKNMMNSSYKYTLNISSFKIDSRQIFKHQTFCLKNGLMF